MPTPRENTSTVNAPVLFRLPHLQRAAATATAASVCGNSGNFGDLKTSQPANAAASPTCGTTDVEKPPGTANSETTATVAQPERLPAASDESFMTRWGLGFKRSVILLAAVALLWGAWAIGQKSATVANDGNLADISETEPGSDSAAVTTAIAATNATSADPEVAPQVAQIVEPKLNASSGSSSDFMPVTEPQTEPPPSVYGRDDVADTDTQADFSQLSLDALQPPSNGEFYQDYDLDENDLDENNLADPAQTAAQKLPVESDTDFVPTETPEMPGFDPNKIGNVGHTAQPDMRPVLSSTPNGIIDWSRYLPGASGNGSIRAASATQTIGGTASESQSADTQAIYLDENDPNAPGVGVAPFYR